VTLSPKAGGPPINAQRWQRLLFAILLLSCFLYFNWGSVRVRFVEDDMMNMVSYWRPGPWHLLYSHVLIWRGEYRPMGGLFYLPMLHLFGLNPAPFHVLYLVLLLANVYLVYRFARVLGCTELTAGLAALIPCYHVGMAILYYAMSNIYDVLCCLFYLAAFLFYAQIRQRGRLLERRELATFFLLYLCALNSKEMAVTLPVVLLVYEWIYHGWPRMRELGKWLRGPGRVAFFAGMLNVIYIYGRALGPEGVAAQPAYKPLLSMHRVWVFQMAALETLVSYWHFFDRRAMVIFWVGIFYLAFRRPRPVLRFCCVFLIVTPLPVEFLMGRGEATLYLPLAGWAVFVAVIFVDLARAVADLLAGEPLLRYLGSRALFAVFIAAGVCAWAYENERVKHMGVTTAMDAAGKVTGEVIQQFRALQPRVSPGSEVVFLDDPFQEFDMAFMAELWFRDRSVNIRLQRKTPLSPQELARVKYLFTYADGKLVQIR
jgi:hypothetical protein